MIMNFSILRYSYTTPLSLLFFIEKARISEEILIGNLIKIFFCCMYGVEHTRTAWQAYILTVCPTPKLLTLWGSNPRPAAYNALN